MKRDPLENDEFYKMFRQVTIHDPVLKIRLNGFPFSVMGIR